MEETPTALLLGGVILLILMAVGVFAATLVYLQRAQASKQRRSTRPRRARTSVANPPSPVEESTPPPAQPATTPGEIMRVIRDESTGKVLIEIEGQRYAHIKEIQDARIGRQVLWAIADLIRFTGGLIANPQALRAARAENKVTDGERHPRTTPNRPIPQTAKETAPPPPNASRGSPPSLPPRPAAEPTPPSLQPQHRYNIVEFFRRGFQPREPVEALSAPTSFVDEIEEILQRRIAEHTPPLSRSVHVRTGPTGLLQIVVGVEVYDSADEIPYPEIKALIKAAVAEWERR